MLIRYEKSSVFHVNGKVLKPGINKVSPSWWAETKKHKSVTKRIELGILVEETPLEDIEDFGDDMVDEVAVEHILSLNVSNARNLINDTVDLELLKAWKEKDERKTVRDAIEKQIATLEAEPELRDRSQSRQVSTGSGPEVVNIEAKPSSQDD